MRILWVSNDGTGVVVLIIIIVIFVLIFAALFMLNLFSAKIRLTFYVDGQDVKKYYVKVNQNIEIPEELNMFTWYEDEECTRQVAKIVVDENGNSPKTKYLPYKTYYAIETKNNASTKPNINKYVI